MDPAVIGRTLETLGKVIRKPPLTEKLLGKPPFRYLHDILTEVIRTTGFFKGLYTDSELKSDNVKEKDAKINFLQKAVDVIALVTGEPLTVKPARIVAGHEPEKTNELLQAIGKCCLEKLSSNEAVRRVLAGEKPDSRVKSNSKPQDKVSIDAKDKDRKRNKQDKRESDNREGSGSRERREKHFEEERKNVEKEREQKKESEKDRVGEEQRNGLKEGEKMNKEKNKARDSRLDTEINKIKEKNRDRKSDGSRRKEKDRIKENGSERDHGKERSKEMDPERHKRKERAREDEQREREEIKIKEQEKTMRKSKGSDNSPKRALEDPMKENKSAADKERLSNAVKAERPSASKLRERRPARFDMEGESDSEEEKESSEPPATDFKENLDVQSPNMTQRRIPRPGSARPAPPRVRRQGSAEVPVPERVGSGKELANVIVDKEKEDDDEFVVEEAPLQLPDMPEMELGQRVELREDEKHGALVNKILETKKDYDTQADTENKEKVFLSDAGKKQEKDLVIREIEKLRSSIQTLCRSALPLGKIMDYLQEDVDTMQNELQIWRRENNRHAKALLQEQSVTETAVEPLKAELAELEQLIKEQQDKICSMKANILRNEVKIQKMVLRINV
ncbi:TRAF3-interacting protein 1 isoform X2 [Xenopus laevis]|uniref:TRAF3-interacting protein 1 n=1 Tax=Xenopus laevis TaxID=8355 RepID=A0A8J0U1U9_XENLA|nr:TRAF3-interacting protein 1 isoform X2 [Xenopus laevis]